MRNRFATIALLVLIAGCRATPEPVDEKTIEAALADYWDARAYRRLRRGSVYEAAFAWAMAARIEPDDAGRRDEVEWALREMNPTMLSQPSICWRTLHSHGSDPFPLSYRWRLEQDAREEEQVRQYNHKVVHAVIAEPVLALDERFLTREQRDRAFAAARAASTPAPAMSRGDDHRGARVRGWHAVAPRSWRR